MGYDIIDNALQTAAKNTAESVETYISGCEMLGMNEAEILSGLKRYITDIKLRMNETTDNTK